MRESYRVHLYQFNRCILFNRQYIGFVFFSLQFSIGNIWSDKASSIIQNNKKSLSSLGHYTYKVSFTNESKLSCHWLFLRSLFLVVCEKVLSPIFVWWPADQKCEKLDDNQRKEKEKPKTRKRVKKGQNIHPRSNRFFLSFSFAFAYVVCAVLEMIALAADVLALISCVVSNIDPFKANNPYRIENISKRYQNSFRTFDRKK